MTFQKMFPLLVLAAALVACGKEATPAARRGGTDIHTDPFKFGVSTDAKGIVTIESDSIPAGLAAAMSFYVRNAPTRTQVRVVWMDVASKVEVGEEVKPIDSDGFVAFQKPLPEGSYRVEMFHKLPEAKDWRYLGTHVFRVVKKISWLSFDCPPECGSHTTDLHPALDLPRFGGQVGTFGVSHSDHGVVYVG